jgi:protease I
LDDADPEDFDALYLPGGAVNADSLRINSKAQQFVIDFEQKDKPIAAMCHGPWLLVSSNLVTGRTLTSWETIKDDIRNAGGRWIDFETVFDDNWITSRGPKDLPAFKEASILLFESCLVTAEEFLGDLEETE